MTEKNSCGNCVAPWWPLRMQEVNYGDQTNFNTQKEVKHGMYPSIAVMWSLTLLPWLWYRRVKRSHPESRGCEGCSMTIRQPPGKTGYSMTSWEMDAGGSWVKSVTKDAARKISLDSPAGCWQATSSLLLRRVYKHSPTTIWVVVWSATFLYMETCFCWVFRVNLFISRV